MHGVKATPLTNGLSGANSARKQSLDLNRGVTGIQASVGIASHNRVVGIRENLLRNGVRSSYHTQGISEGVGRRTRSGQLHSSSNRHRCFVGRKQYGGTAYGLNYANIGVGNNPQIR